MSAENAGRQEVAREVFQNRREVRGRATQDTASIRTREHVTDNSAAESGISPAQQAARKAAAQDIIGRKKQQKEEELGFERTHFSQQVEATQASPCTSKASGTVVTESAQVSNGFHNTSFSPGDTPRKRKSRSGRNPTCPFVLGILPFRSRPPREPQRKCPTQPQNMLPRKPKRPPPLLRKKVFMPQPPLDAGCTGCKKGRRADGQAGTLCGRSGKGALRRHWRRRCCGCSCDRNCRPDWLRRCYLGSQDDSMETLPLSAEVEAYEPVIRKYAKQYGIPDYVLLIQAVMMQESGGRGSDPMQASECWYNTQYPERPEVSPTQSIPLQWASRILRTVCRQLEPKAPLIWNIFSWRSKAITLAAATSPGPCRNTASIPVQTL